MPAFRAFSPQALLAFIGFDVSDDSIRTGRRLNLDSWARVLSRRVLTCRDVEYALSSLDLPASQRQLMKDPLFLGEASKHLYEFILRVTFKFRLVSVRPSP